MSTQLDKEKSIRIESYYTSLLTCLHHFVLYIQVITITLLNTNI